MSKKRRFDRISSGRSLAASALAAMLLIACAAGSSRGTAENSYASGAGEAGSEKAGVEETIGDPTLARELVMESVRTERREGRLFVQFNLRNNRASNLPIEWTLVWFDDAGFRLGDSQHWTPAVLGGKGFETISKTAPTPAASAFRLALRKPNTVR